LESISPTYELLLDYLTCVAEDLMVLNRECNGSIFIEVLPHIEKTRDKTIEQPEDLENIKPSTDLEKYVETYKEFIKKST
jgi:hypothetical protein